MHVWSCLMHACHCVSAALCDTEISGAQPGVILCLSFWINPGQKDDTCSPARAYCRPPYLACCSCYLLLSPPPCHVHLCFHTYIHRYIHTCMHTYTHIILIVSRIFLIFFSLSVALFPSLSLSLSLSFSLPLSLSFSFPLPLTFISLIDCSLTRA